MAAAVEDVKCEIAEKGHIAKKRRVGADTVEDIAEDNNKVCRKTLFKVFVCVILNSCDRQLTLFFLSQATGAAERRARRGRGGPKFLDTVAEENAGEEEDQKKEEEPIAVAQPSPAPAVEEPKPATKVTRAKRGRKVKAAPEEPVEQPIAAPEEPAQEGKLQIVLLFVGNPFFSFNKFS